MLYLLAFINFYPYSLAGESSRLEAFYPTTFHEVYTEKCVQRPKCLAVITVCFGNSIVKILYNNYFIYLMQNDNGNSINLEVLVNALFGSMQNSKFNVILK